MKKLLAIILTLVMVLSLAATAFAAETDETTAPSEPTTEVGSITINGAGSENVYSIYKMLDLESYDTAVGAYAYKINSAWTGFFNSESTPNALAHMAVDADGYVTWIAAEDDDTKASFAKLALAYAKANGIAPVKSSVNEGEFVIADGKGVFSDLELGYYLVDSTMGALCGLTTTNPNASINAKNGQPTISKTVEEDSTSQYGERNTADIGQTVNFLSTITVHAGAEKYIMHDKMDAGLTYQGVSKIELIRNNVTSTVDTKNYTVKAEGLTDGCTFEVVFTQEFCDGLETNDKLLVYYSAMLNRDAVIAGVGNDNETWLDFGDDHHTTHDKTTTYTFGFDIVKTDSQNTLIDGAEFRIYDAATGGTEIGVVLMDDGVTYRRARQDEQDDGLTVPIVVKDGKVRVVGFDNGTYYLEETKNPDGYNKLTARQKFIISDANLDSIFNDGIYSTGSGVHVVNKNGTMLPETGAMGTTLFITFGTFVILATGILLVTKKRMSMIQE